MATTASRRNPAGSGRTLRVSVGTYEQLAERARSDDTTISDVVARFLREVKKKAFFAEYDRAMRALRQDPDTWADYRAELGSMDGTLMDGLEEDW